MNNREGELGPHPFRTDRIYHIDESWFIAIRGGEDVGPFKNRDQASNELDNLLAQFQQ